jgi:hypothetical protein
MFMLTWMCSPTTNAFPPYFASTSKPTVSPPELLHMGIVKMSWWISILDTSALAPILAGFRYKAGCTVRSPEGKIKTLEAPAKDSIDVQA